MDKTRLEVSKGAESTLVQVTEAFIIQSVKEACELARHKGHKELSTEDLKVILEKIRRPSIGVRQ